ncbi:HNH endonuclease [Pseudomonas sp. NPDC089741]|uniref:HNH endonuclease n=1 Tax=Pseudomonas sp. NPDC089741 TaxID=3364470 RepID=UPI003801D7FA
MFNATRTYPAPASLAQERSYDSADVYTELRKVFFDKCYICETNDPHDINIEHFFAHEGDVGLKYDWNNLYFACSRCNNIKSNAFNEIIDCCDPEYDAFRSIKLLPPMTPRGKSVMVSPTNQDPRTIKTSELLVKVFNSDHTVNKRISSEFLRDKVFKQYNLLLDQMDSYFDPLAMADDKNKSIDRMRMLIQKRMPYSAFIRWCILEDNILGPLLVDDMD